MLHYPSNLMCVKRTCERRQGPSRVSDSHKCCVHMVKEVADDSPRVQGPNPLSLTWQTMDDRQEADEEDRIQLARDAEAESKPRPVECRPLPVKDPLTSLPAPAQELLEAARRLLIRDGVDGLHLEAIVEEAGKAKAAVKYYFGNKEGLIFAIVDAGAHKQCRAIAEQTNDVAGEERLSRYVKAKLDEASDLDEFLAFYDLCPLSSVTKDSGPGWQEYTSGSTK